ncbi:MAG: methyltransferase family protein [bacterium]
MKAAWPVILPRVVAIIKNRWPYVFFPILILFFIYWLLTPRQREWTRDYLVPVLFFLALAGRTLWRAIKLLRSTAAKGSFVALLSVNYLLVLSFMALTIFSYIIRSKPTHRAVGIKERAFPLSVVLFHLIGSYLIATRTQFHFHIVLYIGGIMLSILGVAIDCLAMWRLRRSFSIMAEVRSLITSGIYGWIRHPLYAGELIHFLGIALVFNNIPTYGMCAVLIVLQSMRALIEERKLTAHFPEYMHYRKQAGFFFPKHRRVKMSPSDGVLLPP